MPLPAYPSKWSLLILDIYFIHVVLSVSSNRSYNNWISRMAAMDHRLLEALRMIRTGEFVYGVHFFPHQFAHAHCMYMFDINQPVVPLQKDTGVSSFLMEYCTDVGLPQFYGDPKTGRIHCDLVHDGLPGGCEGNALRRFSKGFAQAFLVCVNSLLVIFVSITCQH